MSLANPFNEEHERIRKSLKEFVEGEIKPYADEWEEAGELPREIFRKMGELGFLGLRLSEEYGGSDLDFWSIAVLVQELVRSGHVGVAVSIMAHAEFATTLIDELGTSEQKKEFLVPAIQGERIGSLAVTEPDAGSDVANISTRAERDGDEYILNGTKTFASNASIADFLTTAVRTGESGYGGISLILVPTDLPGISTSRIEKLGIHCSNTAEVAFQDCRVPASSILGSENEGFKWIMSGFEAERLVLALIITTTMRMALEEAREYGQHRRAFGRPILGFQSWQHRLADALTTIEAAETLTYRAIDQYVEGEDCNAEISMAKLFSAESCVRVLHDCAQIWGGYRYTEETLVGRLQRDSLAFSVGAGTSEMQREIIARERGLHSEE